MQSQYIAVHLKCTIADNLPEKGIYSINATLEPLKARDRKLTFKGFSMPVEQAKELLAVTEKSSAKEQRLI